MKVLTLLSKTVLGLAAAVLVLTAAGCSKEEAPPPAAAAPTQETPPAEAAPLPAPVVAQQPDAPPDEPQVQLQVLDTRMANQDYEGAVDVILRAQIAAQQNQSALSDQQRIDYHNRMRQLQKQIADAIASGDPNAQRAARLLMQYNAAQTR
jgi:hypothetical protein